MAESTFTQTGVAELRAMIDRFPAAVTSRLRGVANAAAVRVRDRAQRTLASPSPPPKYHPARGAKSIANAITISEDVPNKQVLVTSKSPSGAPGNLVLWYEHGTVHQPARPYMRPAAAAEEARYRADMTAAVDRVAAETFGG